MKKMLSLFKRNYEGDGLAYNEVTPGAEWVINGEGVATVKMDGTCCLIQDGEIYKRYDAKHGKTPPEGFIPAQPEADPVTGHWPGWLKVSDKPEDKYHREAFDKEPTRLNGTYELVGPKVQGNPYNLDEHLLTKHGAFILEEAPTSFEELVCFLDVRKIEGIVWHHPDGRMVKIKRRDFGYEWLPKKAGV